MLTGNHGGKSTSSRPAVPAGRRAGSVGSCRHRRDQLPSHAAFQGGGNMTFFQGYRTPVAFFCFGVLDLVRWAVEPKRKRKSKATAYGHHRMHLLGVDLVLNDDCKKLMENVMHHYEAILRKEAGGKPCALSDFYWSKDIGRNVENVGQVTATVPSGSNLVRYDDNFEDCDAILDLLTQGYIVISTKKSEVGVEYLSPYQSVQ